MTVLKKGFCLLSSLAILGACSSAQMKQRKEQRDKFAQTSKIYCDFVNGELYPDVEVMLNLEMAKRCEGEKPFSITSYKTPSENVGLMYCCTTSAAKMAAGPAAPAEKSTPAKSDDKKSEEQF